MSNGMSVSMHCGSKDNAIKNLDKIKYADKHNNRKYTNYKNEDINKDLIDKNVILVGTNNAEIDIKEFYKKEFSEAVYEYNKNQPDERRKVIDYLDKMEKDKKSNIAVEFLFQIGNAEDWKDKTIEEKQKTIEIFKKAIPLLDKRNIKCFSAVVHLDETNPHMHLLAVPVIENQKRGLSKQVSQNKVITPKVLEELRKEVEDTFITEYNKAFNDNKTLKKGSEIPYHLKIDDYKKIKNVIEVAKKVKDKVLLKEAVEKDLEKVTAELEKKEKESKELSNKITQLEKTKEDIETLNKTLTANTENISNLKQKINYQYEDIRNLENQKDNNNSIIEMYQNNVAKTNEKIDNLKKEFNQLEDEKLEKAKKNENIKREIEEQNTIRKQQEIILKDIENAENLRKERQKRLKELEEENKELLEKIKEQENILKKLENRSQENEEKIKKLKEDEDTIMSKISNNSNNIEVDIVSLMEKINPYELVKKYNLQDKLPAFEIYNTNGELLNNLQEMENIVVDNMGQEYWDNMKIKDIKEWEELHNSEKIIIYTADGNNYNGYDDYSKKTIREFLENNKDIAKELEKAYNKHSKEKVKDELEEETTKEVEKDFFKF